MSKPNATVDSLEDYLRLVFKARFGRLMNRVSRWTDIAAPLNPETYPKGNTQQVPRWQIAEHLYPYLHANRQSCEAMKERLLSQMPFMEGAPALLSPSVQNDIVGQYPGLVEGIRCPLTGEPVTVDDVKEALDQTSRLGNQEINIVFANVPAPGEGLNLGSLSWTTPPHDIYALRGAFAGHDRLLSKVQTKAYLTDRRQTGDYPTNREARWEAHPNSPQFAVPRDCRQIEAKLLAQMLTFSRAPRLELGDRTHTRIEALLQSAIEPGTFRCPISGRPIDYQEFLQVAETSAHGRSQYQAAHLVPLAMEGGYHVADNMSWITELGNQVQGEYAVEDIVEEIFRMARFHKDRLGLSWQDIEEQF